VERKSGVRETGKENGEGRGKWRRFAERMCHDSLPCFHSRDTIPIRFSLFVDFISTLATDFDLVLI
jgi:hypothetical protein